MRHDSHGLPLPGPEGLCLSLVEKWLLRQGWQVSDFFDRAENRVLSRAQGPGGLALVYPKPTHAKPGEDRAARLAAALQELAGLLGLDQGGLAERIRAEYDQAPPGFVCRLCGQCCGRLGDAHRGLVSVEEVELWRALGRADILRLVAVEEKPGLTRYVAWKNPKTGRHFKRCPWVVKVPGEPKYVCRIHAVKPLKCRAFPLSRGQAEYAHCPGFGTEEGRG
jgi:Fe-S-cluster containining protein